MISGFGLHSGAPCRVRLHQSDGAVRFRRGRQDIPARLDHVVATTRCTTLGCGNERVAMVEHLLAALYVRGWWQGLVIEVSGEELPMLDGSAAPWLNLIEALGTPPAVPAPWTAQEPVSVALNEATISLRPGAPKLCVGIEFAHPAIGRQRWCGGPARFEELLDARTFGFLEELEALRSRGLATAASLENAIVFGGEGPLQPLRYHDEPVRHKALDALGDLYLLGRPLAGKLEVTRGSHSVHIEFMHKLWYERRQERLRERRYETP